MSDKNWADNGEDDFFDMVSNEIENNKQTRINKIQESKEFIINFFDKMDVSFEPDPSYRDNVKSIIRGLVLYQLFKQRTISIYKKGKEDREYLGSFMMYTIQKYLNDNVKVTEWNNILTDVYKHFKSEIKFSDIDNVVEGKINLSKIIPNNILLSTLNNNKKEYIKRKNIEPPDY